MHAGFSRPALALALVAMLLRALLPAGWMPNPAGPARAFITICTMNGPVHMAWPGTARPAPDRRSPDQHSSDHANAPCAFAAAAPLAALAQTTLLVPPLAAARFVSRTHGAAIQIQSRDRAHAPRGPPIFLA
jgi:hypothetical protein